MGVQTKGYIAFQVGWFKRENPHWYLLFLIHLVKCRSSLQWTKKQPLYYFYQFRSKIHSRLFLFFNPHAKICLLISEREREGWGRERNIDVRLITWERKTDQPPPVLPQVGTEPSAWTCALTSNQTHSPLVYGTMLQPTESPGQGHSRLFHFWSHKH